MCITTLLSSQLLILVIVNIGLFSKSKYLMNAGNRWGGGECGHSRHGCISQTLGPIFAKSRPAVCANSGSAS